MAGHARFPTFSVLRRAWQNTPAFRRVLVAALAYFTLRLAMQAFLLFDPASQEIAADLQTYIDAARAFQERRDLYLAGPLQVVNFYQYAPFYALTFAPFLLLTPFQTAVVHTLIHLASYILLFLWWGRIFDRLGLPRAGRCLARSLPAWVVFSAFWGDLAYLNIYLIVALLATLLIESVLEERPGWAALWLVLILQVKPHWGFAALVPLLMGRRAFFLRLLGLAAAGYAATVLVTLAAGGAYAWQQYLEYIRFLPSLSTGFPWRGPESGFLGYNHSIKQVVVFWLGLSPFTLALADFVKAVLLIPLGLIALFSAARPVEKPAREDPLRFLDLCFALYLGAFLWLDMVWELSLGIAIFVYLVATLRADSPGSRLSRGLVWAGFLLYALIDLWQVISYLAIGPQVLIQDAYIASDPSIYAPVILILTLVFYLILSGRLWAAVFHPGSELLWRLRNS
jgi:hypothetical protein